MSSKPLLHASGVFLLAAVLCLMPSTGAPQGLGKVKAKPAAPKEDKLPPELPPEKVDSYLAGLSDVQARRLLASELKAKAAAKSGKGNQEQVGERETGLVLGFFAAQRALAAVADQLAGILAGVRSSADTELYENLFGGKGPGRFPAAIAALALIVFLGWSAERLLLRRVETLRSRLPGALPYRGGERAGLFLFGLVVDGLGIAVYVLVTFLAYFILYGSGHPAYLVSSALIVSYYFRLIEMSARVIVSPRAPELRLVFLSDSDARLLYKWIVLLTASVVPGTALALALQKSGASRELFLFVYATAGPLMSLLLVLMIWQVRHRVARVICPDGEPLDGTRPGTAMSLRRNCADLWQYPATLLALLIGGAWWVRILTHADTTILKLVMSLFLIPLCIGMDQWLHQMLTRMRGMPREIIDFSVSGEESGTGSESAQRGTLERRGKGTDMSLYFPLIRKTFRATLLVFAFFAALQLWGIEFDIGWIFARSVLGVLLALIFGLMAWEVVRARIDRRIEEEVPFSGDEGEEGGSGGSRSGTLLLLLRKFILTFLVIVVGFSILASLGVNIAPLLAGAGVVGLAIGFGSQTLVKDIISGVFFLIDDAFRVGDYVEAGTAKGTVEQISLRSLRLRHPRGQIFVVPFGDLKMVQNFTRDYIIEKLDIRVRFDTDPEVIRKIVKRINKEILADAEFANVLLSDIKSVGVRAMDDSAMIMRVKFKCLPGEQFTLRREVFHRIQKAFKEKGIEFAHRNVTVYLPPQPVSEPGGSAAREEDRSALLEAAGAAAAAAIAQEEAEALAQAAAKKKPE